MFRQLHEFKSSEFWFDLQTPKPTHSSLLVCSFLVGVLLFLSNYSGLWWVPLVCPWALDYVVLFSWFSFQASLWTLCFFGAFPPLMQVSIVQKKKLAIYMNLQDFPVRLSVPLSPSSSTTRICDMSIHCGRSPSSIIVNNSIQVAFSYLYYLFLAILKGSSFTFILKATPWIWSLGN